MNKNQKTFLAYILKTGGYKLRFSIAIKNLTILNVSIVY